MSGSGELDLSITDPGGDPNQPGPPGPNGEATGALAPGTQVAGKACLLVGISGKAVGWIQFGGNVQPLGGVGLAALLAGCGATISPDGTISGPNGTTGAVFNWDQLTPIEKDSIAVYGMVSDPSDNGERESNGGVG